MNRPTSPRRMSPTLGSHDRSPRPAGPPGPTGAQLAVQLAMGLGAGAALGLLLWPFLPALVTAAVLALVMAPIQGYLRSRTGRGHLAAAVTTFLAVALVLVPAFFVGSLMVREVAQAAEWLATGAPEALRSLPQLERSVDGWAQRFGLERASLGEAVAERVRGAPDALLGHAVGLVAGVGGLPVQAGVAVFTLFFLLRDAERVESLLRGIIPLDANRTSALLFRAREVVSAAVYGNLLVALVQGTIGGIAFLALGLPTPIVWAAIMGLASLIPMVGPGVVWLPTAIFLIASGSLARGVALLAVGILVISTVDNVIRSVLVGSKARIHPLAIFFGVLGGIVVFGAVGVFVGPVVLVLSLLILEMVRLGLFPSGSERDLPVAEERR